MKKFKYKTKKTSPKKKVYNLNYINFLFYLFHFFVDLIIIKMVSISSSNIFFYVDARRSDDSSIGKDHLEVFRRLDVECR